MLKKAKLAAVCMVLAAGWLGAKERALFEPPDGKTLLIVGQGNESIYNYMAVVKVVPAGLMSYTSIQNVDGLEAQAPDYGGGKMFAGELMDKYPGTMLQLGLYMVDVLEDISRGIYDRNIDRMGVWFKKMNRPVFLRIGYEFDGPHNHYDPQQYKKAYRHIVDRLRKDGVRNVAYVWHSNADKTKHQLIEWFPGDEYVDWVGITYFAQPRVYMEPVLVFARAHNKPVMTAESTPFGTGTGDGMKSWYRWFQGYFKFVESNNIKAVCYINCDWDALPMWKNQGWGDSRVQANAEVLKMWLSETAKDRYIKAADGYK
jgi:hypothetical protein